MIIDYISDLHENFYFKHNKKLSQKEFKEFFDTLYTDEKAIGEVLIIAGDISEYNHRIIDILHLFKKVYEYKAIFFTLGNHEFYLKNVQHGLRYLYSSEKKIEELLELSKELEKDNIFLLNGTVVKYKEISFGGAMGWYDGSYAKKLNNQITDKMINTRWIETNKDYKFILNLKNYRIMYPSELIKINDIVEEIDVMITHINPLSEPIAFPESFKKNQDNAFYAFDGENLITRTTAKYWIFGHSHTPWAYQLYGIKFLSNPLGYPEEANKRKSVIKSFLISKK